MGGSGAGEPAAQGRLKITDIKTVVVNAQMRNWVFVKVETDTPGLDGWGEASLEWKTRAVAAAVEDLKPFVIGDDPTRIEHLYQKLYRQPFFRPGVIGLSAISGIEQACWDILGKQLGVPVYKLLGGAVRDKVRMYTHLGGGEMSAVYESFDASRVIDLALEVVARGYTAVKVVFVPYSEPLMGAPYAKKLAAVMGRLREAVGDRVDIMVDFHGRTYPAVAIEYINAIAEYRPYFCEEPVPPENIDALAEVCRAVRVPIATGERLATRHQFREVLEKRAARRDPAGPVPLRRVAGGQEDRGDGGGLLRGRGAAQSAGADRQCGGAALRAIDAEFSDPGRYAGGRAVALGGGGKFAAYGERILAADRCAGVGS